MKNYRQLTRYQPHEWEDDKEWRARRLQFLWDMRSYYTSDYLRNGMADEKDDFYDINDSTVSSLASLYDRYADGEFERYEKMSNNECSNMLKRLERLKDTNKQEFLLKCNCNLYNYIVENRMDDVKTHRQDMGESLYD